MSGLVRNILIGLGVIAGGLLAFAGFVREVEKPADEDVVAASEPVRLQTARPLRPDVVPLAKPASLESGFGRTEFTGIPTTTVPIDPLHELAFDRRWEGVLEAPPPPPPADLPAARAADEILEPEIGDTASQEKYEFDTLSGEAAARAEEGLVSLRKGTDLLKQGMAEFRRAGEEGREGRRKIRESADILRDARDKFDAALRIAPGHPELLRLMQETKANLYAAMKH